MENVQINVPSAFLASVDNATSVVLNVKFVERMHPTVFCATMKKNHYTESTFMSLGITDVLINAFLENLKTQRKFLFLLKSSANYLPLIN
jgi:poly-gamma-glutamate capsule biosynthesis protein CapA/YwtB (metallophosphatase superfamily)